MKVLDCAQRSEEWTAVRLGRLTSTGAAAMLSEGKGSKEAVGRRNLRIRLALERLVGRSLERDFMTPAMRDGVDREEDAYAAYQALTGRLLDRSGFCQHDTLMAGCSLDGSMDDFTGIVEIKSPTPAIHWEYVRSGEVPSDYRKQVLHALWITGAQFCDWFSFNPDFPENIQVKIVRVERASVNIDDYERQAVAFLREVDLELQAIRTVSDTRGQFERSLAV